MRKIFTSLAVLTMCCITGFAQVVYSTDFATEEDFNSWSVVDANEDENTWNFNLDASPSHVYYSYHSTNPANDWMISPAITSEESGFAAILFKVKGSSYTEKLQVFKGNSTSIDAMSPLGEVLTLNDTEQSFVYLTDVTANEPFYLGFQACSDPDKFRLYLCNVSVQITQNPVDLMVTELVSPVSDSELGNESVTIKVKNNGTTAVESFDVSFSVDDELVATETVNTPIAIGEEMEYTFNTTADLSTPRKSFSIKAWTAHADDVNPANDAYVASVLHKAPATVPYFMGFEASEYVDGITLLNLNEDSGDWTLYSDPWWTLSRTGDYCLAYNYDRNNNADDWAILDPIAITEPGYYVLKFWYSGDDTHPEKLGVYYGNEANPSAMTNKIVEYAPFARSAYAESINIINIEQPQTLYIGFHAFSDKDENWLCVDDVTFEKIESDDIDIAVTDISYPQAYVRNAGNKQAIFNVQNYGISDVEAVCKVKIGETTISEQPISIKAQEVKTLRVDGTFANLEAGDYTLTVEVTVAEDKSPENNSMSKDFHLLGTAAKLWNFEDGQLPADFTFRAEDEGSVNPSAGEEFNEYGWGLFNIVTHEDFGEYVLAGTSWLDNTEQADRWCILPPYTPDESSVLVWDVASFNPQFLETYSIMISTNGDDSWYYYTAQEYHLESAEFKTRGIELSEYAGQEIYIAFRLRSKNCEALVLDNIALYDSSEMSGINEVTDNGATINVSDDAVTVTGADVNELKVYNMSGAVVATSTTNQVSVSGLAPGVYVVNVSTANGMTSTKFVKK